MWDYFKLGMGLFENTNTYPFNKLDVSLFDFSKKMTLIKSKELGLRFWMHLHCMVSVLEMIPSNAS